MNINIDRVLESKTDPIKEAFSVLCESGTFADNIRFVHNLMRQPKNIIHENLSYLYKVPNGIGIKYFNSVIETTNDITLNNLTAIKTDLTKYMSDLASDKSELEESMSILDKKIEYKNADESFRDEIVMKMFEDRLATTYATEASYLADDLEIIAYNINDNFEAIDDYERIIRKVKMSQNSEYFSNYPMLLNANTSMILNLRRDVFGDVRELFVCLPNVIADKLITLKASKATVSTIIKVFDKQVKRMTKHAKESKDHYAIVTYYLGELRVAKDKLVRYLVPGVKESYTRENIAEMQPDIINYEAGVIEDIAGYMSDDFEAVEAELEDSLVEVLLCGDNLDNATLEHYIKISDRYETLCEAGAVKRAITRTTTKAATGSRKVTNKITDAEKTGAHVVTGIKYTISPIVNKINNTIDKIKKMDKEERVDRMVTGKTRVTLIGLLRAAVSGIIIGGVAASVVQYGPIATAAIKVIGVITSIAINRHIDLKVRRRLVIDLENELKIVNEKIEDAKRKDDDKAKYELMRIANKLEKDITKVKFNLKY